MENYAYKGNYNNYINGVTEAAPCYPILKIKTVRIWLFFVTPNFLK